MQDIILSPYTFLFENEGDYYVFNSESLFFSRINKDIFITLSNRDFTKLDFESKDILIKKRIIIYKEDKDTCYNHLLTRHLTSAYADDTMALIIAPTTACNFACPYCFEPKKNPKYISRDVEEKITEYINKQEHIKKISLVWYGGEPLLAKDAIRRIYTDITTKTEKEIINHEIISNTYLVDDDVIEIFKDCNINKIQVSLDGTEENHNKTRFVKSSRTPTFKTIEQNIEKLAKALPALHISIRVNINKNNWEDFVSIYHKYHGEDWHQNIGVYPGIIREDSTDRCTLKHQCYQIPDLLDLHFKFIAAGVNVNMFPSVRFKGCMLQRANAFIIGPEGELYKCWNDVSNPEKIVGSIMDNELRNYYLLMRYMQDCRPIRDDCKGCHALPICDGGCGYQQYRNKFENAELHLCTFFKDKSNLKRALLYSIGENKNSQNKILNL